MKTFLKNLLNYIFLFLLTFLLLDDFAVIGDPNIRVFTSPDLGNIAFYSVNEEVETPLNLLRTTIITAVCYLTLITFYTAHLHRVHKLERLVEKDCWDFYSQRFEGHGITAEFYNMDYWLLGIDRLSMLKQRCPNAYYSALLPEQKQEVVYHSLYEPLFYNYSFSFFILLIFSLLCLWLLCLKFKSLSLVPLTRF